MFHEVFEKDAARPVDDALGLAGSARRIEDVQGVVKRQVEEPDFLSLVWSQESFQREGAVGERTDRTDRGILRHDYQTANFRQGVRHLGEATGDVVASAAVAVAVGGEQHHWTNLSEPVDHP